MSLYEEIILTWLCVCIGRCLSLDQLRLYGDKATSTVSYSLQFMAASAVTVRVAHRITKVDKDGLLRCALRTTAALGYEGWGIDVLLTSDAKLRRLNRNCRGSMLLRTCSHFLFMSLLSPE